MIIAIDFDGTITESCNAGDEVKIRLGAQYYIEKLRNDGHKIIIHTCRHEDNLIDEMIHALHKNNIKYDAINANMPNLPFPAPNKKVYADLYLDDRGFGMHPFPGWQKLYEYACEKAANPMYVKHGL